MSKKLLALLLCAAVCCTSLLALPSGYSEAISFVMKTVTSPTISTEGGDWSVLALARSGENIPQTYIDEYVKNASKVLSDTKGVLSTRKYTEYSRVALCFTALGLDATNIGGYNMIKRLSDYTAVGKQGINGYIFSLIALDSCAYAIEPTAAAVRTTRDSLLRGILSGEQALSEVKTGGFGLTSQMPDADVTAMAITAFAPYMHRPEIAQAVERAISWLSAKQLESGGFKGLGAENCESSAQVVIALSAIGIDCKSDKRFIKNGNNPYDAMMAYQLESGGFKHIEGQTENGIATDQALCAMVAYERMKNGKTAFYDMSDVPCAPAKGFSDISGHWAESFITKHGGFSLSGEHSTFVPTADVTRSEFATAICKALNIEASSENIFTDINKNSLYCGTVNAAAAANILSGVGQSRFNPRGSISREQAMSMAARAVRYAGGSTDISGDKSLGGISGVASYAKMDAEFCINADIFSGKNGEIAPKDNLTRAETMVVIDKLLLYLEEK